MKEYMVVASSISIVTLEAKVNNYLLQGWECQGGVCVNEDSEDNYFIYQAMVRERTGTVGAKIVDFPQPKSLTLQGYIPVHMRIK